MYQILRALCISVLSLLVVLVTPSAFAKSWVSAVTAPTTTTTATVNSTGVETAIGKLTASPTSIAFGSIVVGQSSSILTSTLTNTGNATLHFLTSSMSAGAFAWGNIGSCAVPGTLAVGASCTVSAKFAPTAAGTFSASITMGSDASNPSLSIPLSGTGTTVTAIGKLTASPTSIAFGSIVVGQSSSILTSTLTNTGNATLHFLTSSMSAGAFAWGNIGSCAVPGTLAVGASCTVSAKFAPTAAGTFSASITMGSDASNPSLSIPLSGTGTTVTAIGKLTASPTSIAFGSIVVGKSSSILTSTLTNTGNATLHFLTSSMSAGAFAWGNIGSCAVPGTLAVGASCTVSAKFAPTAAGTFSASITMGSDASNPSLSIPLSGTGTAVTAGTLSVSPTAMGLGSVVVGTSGTASGSLTASGANVTVSAVSSSNSTFSVGGLSLPITIPAGQGAVFAVTFVPHTPGAATAVLTFASNAQSSTTVETLTGTGTPPPTYTVSLTWTASTSSNIAGYNIYRAVYGNSCGSFSKINSALNPDTQYTDSVVADGTDYCYATTALNSSNQESAYSGIVPNVQVPAP